MHFQYSGQTLHHSALRGCRTRHQPHGDVPLPPGLPVWGLPSGAWTRRHTPAKPLSPKPWGKVEGAKGPTSLPLEPPDQLRDRVSPHPLHLLFTDKESRLREVGGSGQGHTASSSGHLSSLPIPTWGDSLLTKESSRVALSLPISTSFFVCLCSRSPSPWL